MSAATSFNYGQNMGNYATTATSPLAGPGDANASWRSYPAGSPVSPVASGYVSYPMAASQASAAWVTSPMDATAGPDNSSRPEDTWFPYQQPTRSTSFSGEHSAQYSGNPNRSFDRRASTASNMYHPTSMETISPTTYATWQQGYQPWYTEDGQPGSSNDETNTNMDGMYYGR
jgi:hypothetical protein